MERERIKNIGITLRPVTKDDRKFLLLVYAAGREIEMAVVPWDEATKRAFIEQQFDAQDTYYRSRYANPSHHIILADGEPAGRVYLDKADTHIAILDIAVLPAFRRKGIATQIVTRLQEGAQGKLIRIYIEAFNPADKLFGELGFSMVEDDGGLRRFEWGRAEDS